MAMTSRAEARLELQLKLEEILGSDRVYYDPPESFKMKYPCFVYARRNVVSQRADNIRYQKFTQYEVTYIDRDPDSDVIDRVLDSFMHVEHSRHFVLDNLHQDVFYIYV